MLLVSWDSGPLIANAAEKAPGQKFTGEGLRHAYALQVVNEMFT